MLVIFLFQINVKMICYEEDNPILEFVAKKESYLTFFNLNDS